MTPPDAEDDSFGSTTIDFDRTLYVPEAAIDAYRNAYPWRLFNDIRTIESNSIESNTANSNEVAIKVADGGIDVVNAPEMSRVIVSGVDGRVVTAMYAESAELHIPLAPGIYLVKVGDTTTAKVLVK